MDGCSLPFSLDNNLHMKCMSLSACVKGCLDADRNRLLCDFESGEDWVLMGGRGWEVLMEGGGLGVLLGGVVGGCCWGVCWERMMGVLM